MEFDGKGDSLFDNVKITYSGAIAENVSTPDDARRVAGEMPMKLAKQMNTLTYKLLPLSVLDSKANRLIRSLDDDLISKTAAALKAGTTTRLKLRDLESEKIFQTQLPAISRESSSFSSAFARADTLFRTTARNLLPDLRDGSTDVDEKSTELLAAVSLFQHRIKLAEEYIQLKHKEANALQDSVTKLIEMGFDNYLGGLANQPLVGSKALRLLLSFGGPSIGSANHRLQTKIEAITVVDKDEDDNQGNDSDSSGGSEDEEWFERQQTLATFNASCDALIQQHLLGLPGVEVIYGVASINRAFPPGSRRMSRPASATSFWTTKESSLSLPECCPNPLPHQPS